MSDNEFDATNLYAEEIKNYSDKPILKNEKTIKGIKPHAARGPHLFKTKSRYNAPCPSLPHL